MTAENVILESDPRMNVRSTDPETSREAAENVSTAAMMGKIVRFLLENDRDEGWTASEIEAAIGGELGTCPWKRISETRSKGYAEWAVTEEGRMRKRPSLKGPRQGVTKITDKGRNLLL